MLYKVVSESLNQYTRPSDMGTITVHQMPKDTDHYLKIIENRRDEIYTEIENNLLSYLEGKDLATPFGQLIVYSDAFTKDLERRLRNTEGGSLNSFEMFEVFSGFNGSSKFSKNLFSKLNESMGAKILFEFSICKELGVSVTKYIKDDEHLGCIAQVISETLPLIIHSYFNLQAFGFDDDQQLEFIRTLIMYLEIDIFARKHQDLVGLIRDVARRQTLEQPF